MSGFGIDFGSHSSVIAMARKKGIDIIANEVSNRLTPSVVVFGDDRRYLGENGLSLDVSNFGNSIWAIKRLLQRMCEDPDIATETVYSNVELVKGEDGMVAAKVRVCGEERVYSFIQLAAMYFSELNEIVRKDTGIYMKSMVISCPVWYTDVQKKGIVDACKIVGIEPLIIMNELTAVSLLYGISKPELAQLSDGKDASFKRVLFFDMGHSTTQVCITEFYKNHANVIVQTSDRNVGGRNIDYAMAVHYAKLFTEKTNVDVISNKKSLYRLRMACQRIKKILSSNPTAQLNVECLVGEHDFTVDVKREDVETLIDPLLPKILEIVNGALKLAKLQVSDIESVELVGGSSRVPIIKKMFADIFTPQKLHSTLNLDEAVARGCALQCAISSPLFKVREYNINDWNPYPLELHWDLKYSPPTARQKNDKEVCTLAFPIGNVVPSSKMLTLVRVFDENETPNANSTYDFLIGFRYREDAFNSEPILLKSNFINQFRITGIRKTSPDCTKATIKIQIKLNLSGIVQIEGAYQVEDVVQQVPCEPEKKSPQKSTAQKSNGDNDESLKRNDSKCDMDVSDGSEQQQESEEQPVSKNEEAKTNNPVDSQNGVPPENFNQNAKNQNSRSNPQANPSAAPENHNATSPNAHPTPVSPPKMKLVNKQLKHPLNIISLGNELPNNVLNSYIETEAELRSADMRVIETGEVRNALEELIYNSRDNVSGAWEQFIDPDKVPSIMEKLDEFESWLYGEGEGTTKEAYASAYEEVKKYVDKVSEKYIEHVKKLEEERRIKEVVERKAREVELKRKQEEEKAKLEEMRKLKESQQQENPEQTEAMDGVQSQQEANGSPDVEVCEPDDAECQFEDTNADGAAMEVSGQDSSDQANKEHDSDEYIDA